MTHTPTPWRRDIGKADKAVLMKMIEAGSLFEGVFSGEQCVALCGDSGADADFIVNACNSYAAQAEKISALKAENKRLRELLKEADKEFTDCVDGDAFDDRDAGIDSGGYRRFRERMKAALAQIGEKS